MNMKTQLLKDLCFNRNEVQSTWDIKKKTRDLFCLVKEYFERKSLKKIPPNSGELLKDLTFNKSEVGY